VRFVAEHADRRTVDGLRWGVEPICTVLTEHGTPIAPSTFYDAREHTSGRQRRDEQLATDVARVHAANYGVYGVRKVWLALNREGRPVARCTVERLMRELGLEGARRGRGHRTTIADPGAPRAADLVQVKFSPARPDAVWVADFTYVATWPGTVYVAFVLDAHSRRILGWRAATLMRTALVLDALEQAIWTRTRKGVDDLSGLVCHHDAGSQYTSIAFTERLAAADAAPSVGTVGDALENALAESPIALFKTELIRRRGPWRNVDEVELATLEWVDWHNNRRLHPPATTSHRSITNRSSTVNIPPSRRSGFHHPESPDSPGRFSVAALAVRRPVTGAVGPEHRVAPGLGPTDRATSPEVRCAPARAPGDPSQPL
jgi:putative transposase